MTVKHTKTKTSYYRRLYVAYLIDTGVNTVPLIMESTGMPRRTLQDTLVALIEIDVVYSFSGGTKNRTYSIEEWGAINKHWIKNNLQRLKSVLQYI